MPFIVLNEIKDEFLHEKELKYFQKLKYEKRQLSYLLGRFSAKQALTFLKPILNPKDIFIDFGIFNYPVTHTLDSTVWRVSFSHSQQYCLALAFDSDQPLAIDMEKHDSNRNKTIENQLTAAEIQICHEKESLFTLFWTAKEALSKVLRTGMTTPFSLFEISKVEKIDEYWRCEFKYFSQYQSLSFKLDSFIGTIIYPKKGKLITKLADMQAWLQTQNQ